MRMPSPVLKRVPGEISRMRLGAVAEMLAHHGAVALESAASEDDGVGGSVSRAPPAQSRPRQCGPPRVDKRCAAQPWRKTTPAALRARDSSATTAGPPPSGWMRGGPFAR